MAGAFRRSLGSLQLIIKSNIGEHSWLWNAKTELGAGHCCSNYVTSTFGFQSRYSHDSGIVEDQVFEQHGLKAKFLLERIVSGSMSLGHLQAFHTSAYALLVEKGHDNSVVDQKQRSDIEPLPRQQIGKNISAVEKTKFLINTLLDLKNSKQAVYGTLDAWVAWEQNFPLAMLKRALLVLEKQEQWHRVVQVVKWMLSKGQGTTMGTYEQLIRALEKDNRAEEAHKIWVKKIGHDLHSVPWRFCDLMLSIYYRNNMLERLVKLFKGLEEFDRKPPKKSIVRKVADAYELLGLLEEKNKLLEKYGHLFSKSSEECSRKSRKSKKASLKNDKKTGTETNENIESSDK